MSCNQVKLGTGACRAMYTLDWLIQVRFAASEMPLHLEQHHQHLIKGVEGDSRYGPPGRAGPPGGLMGRAGGTVMGRQDSLGDPGDRWKKGSAMGPAGLAGGPLTLCVCVCVCVCVRARARASILFCQISSRISVTSDLFKIKQI